MANTKTNKNATSNANTTKNAVPMKGNWFQKKKAPGAAATHKAGEVHGITGKVIPPPTRIPLPPRPAVPIPPPALPFHYATATNRRMTAEEFSAGVRKLVAASAPNAEVWSPVLSLTTGADTAKHRRGAYNARKGATTAALETRAPPAPAPPAVPKDKKASPPPYTPPYNQLTSLQRSAFPGKWPHSAPRAKVRAAQDGPKTAEGLAAANRWGAWAAGEGGGAL
ncbi:hypothetical protein EDC01DRAFT_629977 [Geopyxis carbonaria]|nr:hypothetical protein EDC01DRAFT_629977 [Geopyxis carbonaria]